jgi:hypothetical protein
MLIFGNIWKQHDDSVFGSSMLAIDGVIWSRLIDLFDDVIFIDQIVARYNGC